ncbi:hypothetical protein BC943DRAFT_363969 [Umbelopsis sp. AD052]|nr:hypothetical protein BC943DRAFT_363969 [Umbelopsis sp. AD052]
MAAYGAYPVMAGGAYPPRPTPYLVSPSPYYPQSPMAYGQPGPIAQPLVYGQPYGRPYYQGHGGHDSCCLAL